MTNQIIAIDYMPSTQRGGQERSLFDVIKGFRKEGHRVVLGYCVWGDLIPLYQELGVETVEIPSINIVDKRSIKEWLRFFDSVKILKSSGISKNTVIYLNQIMDLPLGVALKLFTKANRLICHLRLPPLGTPFKENFNQITLCSRFVDKYIVATQNMFEAHTSHGIPANRTAIIPNGFWFDEMVLPSHSPKNNPIKITYLGRIDQAKGIHVALKALADIAKQGYDFEFHIAGISMNLNQEEYQKELELQIKEDNLSEKVKFIGHIQNPLLHFAQYDLTLFPSIWNEPFGRTLVESIIVETPVIANDVGSTAEILNDKAKEWIYNNTANDLSQKIIRFINGANYDMESRVKSVRARYNLSHIVSTILE